MSCCGLSGDVAVALERAAAFARVMAVGSSELVTEGGSDERVADERRRREGYEAVSAELTRAATLWREGALH